jgi:broad specificity phosphatase PhoE
LTDFRPCIKTAIDQKKRRIAEKKIDLSYLCIVEIIRQNHFDRVVCNKIIYYQMKLPGLFLIVMCTLVQCKSTKVYIVRHAEKSTNPPKDPDLTTEGILRAENLAMLLKNKEIKAVYSTDTRRTRQTAEPFSLQEGLSVQTYKNDTLLRFLYHVLDADQNALIVGHSNTVIQMLTELDLRPSIKEIPDNDYDNLFIITLKSKDGTGGYTLKLREKTYGIKSPPVTDTTKPVMSMR